MVQLISCCINRTNDLLNFCSFELMLIWTIVYKNLCFKILTMFNIKDLRIDIKFYFLTVFIYLMKCWLELLFRS